MATSTCYSVDNSQPDSNCGCSEPNYPCVGTSDIIVSTACQSIDCLGGDDGGGTAGGGGSGPVIYMSRSSNDTQSNQVFGEIVQDMHFYDQFTYGTGINPPFVVYTGLIADITGTGNTSALITDCVGTGNNTECFNRDVFNSGGFSNFLVANLDHSYALPSGTKINTQLDAALQSYRIVDYILPNNGCQEVTTSTGLYFYPKVMANANAGQIVLDLPLSTSTGIAGSEFYVKKIDASVNAVIVSGTGSDLIDGQSTYTINNQYEAVKIVNCGANTWYVL